MPSGSKKGRPSPFHSNSPVFFYFKKRAADRRWPGSALSVNIFCRAIASPLSYLLKAVVGTERREDYLN